MQYHIYSLKDSHGQIRYIGQTNNPDRRLKELIFQYEDVIGKDLYMIILETVDTRRDALDREKYWMFEMAHRGEPIINVRRESGRDGEYVRAMNLLLWKAHINQDREGRK